MRCDWSSKVLTREMNVKNIISVFFLIYFHSDPHPAPSLILTAFWRNIMSFLIVSCIAFWATKRDPRKSTRKLLQYSSLLAQLLFILSFVTFSGAGFSPIFFFHYRISVQLFWSTLNDRNHHINISLTQLLPNEFAYNLSFELNHSICQILYCLIS